MQTPADVNPLREGLRLERTPEPCVAVIFGASGDLTKRKLVPALWSLAQQNLLGSGFAVVGTARTPMNDEQFREAMRAAVEQFSDAAGGALDESVWAAFASGLHYVPSDPAQPESYAALAERLAQVDRERGTGGNRLYYLSTPPGLYAPILAQLGQSGLARPGGRAWSRLIVEKPFGRDLHSARALNRELQAVFDEGQVYRIDHYLGKETVQNILVLRFANGIFEPLWNRSFVDHVQITAAESLGVEGRGGYYEQSGALRDMIQNHMLQLLSLVAMEPPASLDGTAVRDEKTKVLRAMRGLTPEAAALDAVRAQYLEGSVGGRAVPGYRHEKGVAPDSATETYAAVRLTIENWRWAGVPFYLRSGKRLAKRVTEIAVQFRDVPHPLFGRDGTWGAGHNTLVLRIQPDEGITLRFGAKLPGQALHVRPVNMEFQYGTSFGRRSPEAYERLLLDAMLGDATLFARGDMVEESWRLVMPLLEAWADPKAPLAAYEAGSWGPAEADALLERDGRRWRRP